jgi:hypothetical protein
MEASAANPAPSVQAFAANPGTVPLAPDPVPTTNPAQLALVRSKMGPSLRPTPPPLAGVNGSLADAFDVSALAANNRQVPAPALALKTSTAPNQPLVVAGPPNEGPPPTRIVRADGPFERAFAAPNVIAVPEIPEPGLIPSARYVVTFARARWQRRKAIKLLNSEAKHDTSLLDQVLGGLGEAARNAKVDGRVFTSENAAISAAEQRRTELGQEQQGVDQRTDEENSKFAEIESQRTSKLSEADRELDQAKVEQEQTEAHRRGLREKRKEIERRQKAYLKAAQDRDSESASAPMGELRTQLRRAAESHRLEAAELEPERQDVERKLAAIERPVGDAQVRLDAAKAEHDAAKRGLQDAREGHGHRLAELDAEKKRKLRDLGATNNEIARRFVTLGTLVNLNRIDDPAFADLYQQVDRLRGALTARSAESEKLMAERNAYHRESLVRGLVVLGVAFVLFIALIVVLRAIF